MYKLFQRKINYKYTIFNFKYELERYVNNYKYKPGTKFNQVQNNNVLSTPLGDNLFSVFAKSPQTKEKINEYLKFYDYDIVYNSVKN